MRRTRVLLMALLMVGAMLLPAARAEAGTCQPLIAPRGTVQWVDKHPNGSLAQRIIFLAEQGQQWTGEWYCLRGLWQPYTHPVGAEPPIWP